MPELAVVELISVTTDISNAYRAIGNRRDRKG
jgi:hypothetical protein